MSVICVTNQDLAAAAMWWFLGTGSVVLGLLTTPAFSLQPHTHDSSFSPDITLSVTRQNISVGGAFKVTTLVNGSLPGPTLRIPEDKTVWIRVYNDITDDNVTMHWHGMTQAAYPFSDGTPFASQWPIPPLHFFDYEVKAPKGSAGTYYYHSHAGFQANSAAGPLIVEDAGCLPFEKDGDRIIFLQEFWNRTDKAVEEGLESVPFNWTGEPNGWLINGKSISNDDNARDASTKALSIIQVEPQKKYRLRIIGATSLSLALLGFEDHGNLEIIEADAQYTEAHAVDLIQIASGQRYSAVLQTKSCTELQKTGRLDYYLQVESRDRPHIVTNYAVLRYADTCQFKGNSSSRVSTAKNPEKTPMRLPPTINGYLDYTLRPLHPINVPTAAEVTRRVVMNVQFVQGKYLLWHINNNSWTEDESFPAPITSPRVPYLVSLYLNQTAYLPNYDEAVRNGGLDPQTQTYPAKMGEIIEIVFQQYGGYSPSSGGVNGVLDTHPWHGHGLHHYDMGGGDGAWDPEVVEQKLRGTSPILRDTTVLYRYKPTTKPGQKQGWRVWRIRVDQPGVWMLHCHTLQHMIMGMQTVWVHGDGADIMKVPKLDVMSYLTYGGDVYGNTTHAPKVLHFDEIL
ncbi:L-ascorbate oxidase [Moelleriella libera RCEF 2490]|uniref:L-ascorbate oxidase n=1 Tax=Moelleriella libera RCEF 2490 TaxID=1081109 RepID=A0A162ITS5_9HYPO|nr:L-ascorbate oxidase [Moelleriella libera RCEF 2490]